MTRKTQDEFEQDKDLDILHEKYQAIATELPPESLDADILQAAHQAVDSQSHISRLKSSRRAWYVPAAYAAVLVLSLSVVLKLAFEPEYKSPEIPETDAMFPHEEALMQAEKSRLKQKLHILSEQKNIDQNRMLKQQSLKQQVVKPASQPKKSQQKIKKTRSHSKRARPDMAAPATIQSVGEMDEKAIASAGIKPETTQVTDKDQQARIKYLIKLYDLQQFEKLKLAMQDYRKDYPIGGDELGDEIESVMGKSESNKLPQVLRDWEQHNQ